MILIDGADHTESLVGYLLAAGQPEGFIRRIGADCRQQRMSLRIDVRSRAPLLMP